MKVSDFALDWSGPLVFSCCEEFLSEIGNQPAKKGMIVECSHCGIKLQLQSVDGILMWRGIA